MTRILIADDEKDERDVVRFLLEKYGFKMDVREAENGRDALDLLEQEHADILLTDVRMPFIQGTELAAHARELCPIIEILFFSGYDEFDYVKSALSVGAVDYILKPIHPEEFFKTIQNVLQRIENTQRKKRELKQASSFRRGYILTRILGGADPGLLAEEYGELVFLEEYRRVVLIQFDAPVFDRPPMTEGIPLENVAEELLATQPHDLVNIDPSQSVILWQGDDNNASQIAQSLQHALSAAAGQPCYVSLSDNIVEIGGLAKAYAQAERALEDRFFYTNVYLYPVEPASDAPQDSAKQDDLIIQALSEAAQIGDAHGLRRSVDILFEKYAEQKEQSHIYVRYLFSQAVEGVSREIPECTTEERKQLVEQVYFCRNFADVRALITELTERAIDYFESEQSAPCHAVQIVQRYIQEHYGNDLSLDILAAQCYLSPRYLSDLFIRETGCGINKYIKNFRMERVRDLLLHTNRKIQDICGVVGYTNFSYFCRSFRETYGQSPEAYRQSLHKDGTGADEE